MKNYFFLLFVFVIQTANAVEEKEIQTKTSATNLEELDDGEMNSVTAQFKTAEDLRKNIDLKPQLIDDTTYRSTNSNGRVRTFYHARPVGK